MELFNRPALFVDASAVFDLCDGDLVLFNKLLDVFQGSLTPIFRGKKIAAAEGTRSLLGSIAPSPANPSLLSTPRGSVSRHGPAPGGPARQVPFWLSCAPQEAQRAALYALWITYREQASEKPGSARGRRVVDILNEYRLTLASMKKSRDVRGIPPASIWSGHLFILAKLTSRECTVEDFMDVVGDGAYLSVTASNGIPGVLIVALAASIVATELIVAGESHALRLLCGKLDTLLADLPSRSSPLRTYLSGNVASHAERFEELWLGATPYSEPKKFKTRVELLFFVTCELVFLAAERAWPALAGRDGVAAPLEAALLAWLTTWKTFLYNVRNRSHSVHRRHVSRSGTATLAPVSGMNNGTLNQQDGAQRTPLPAPVPSPSMSPAQQPRDSPGPSANIPAATSADSDNEMLEQNDALKRICEAMPLRMQHGKAPLPDLRLRLFAEPGSSGSTHVGVSPLLQESLSDSTRGGVSPGTISPSKLPASSLEQDFEYAQQCFAMEAEAMSNDIKLKFYGLYKQSTIGDVNCPKPWLMDAVGRAKWEAWNKLKGMTTKDAKRMYINEYKIMKQLGNAK
ncbi:acyl-CoA binding protein [Strigomonas culicis]|uniref:Acyl-CoA binding protein n=1 Tax=Strigomonas culicis TaxID=28005 RepID=S9VFH0_9TRYP|nr:acyl-CoA binding protein [Strigomonas culicis]|eukprot:EPY25801.1 acyl-CoA binding protein [Strigomonas culicis]